MTAIQKTGHKKTGKQDTGKQESRKAALTGGNKLTTLPKCFSAAFFM